MMRSAAISVLALLCFAATACSEVPNGSVMADTPAAGWTSSEPVAIEYVNCDTLSRRDILFTARIEASSRSSAETLPMEVLCISPSGDSVAFTKVFDLTAARRRALVKEIAEPMIVGAVLTECGGYRFEFRPQNHVNDILAVGIEFSYGKR